MNDAPNSAAQLNRIDADAVLTDDSSDGIDWDDITATTQPDFEAGRFAFDTGDYPTEEVAIAAMEEFMDKMLEEALREAAKTPLDATSP